MGIRAYGRQAAGRFESQGSGGRLIVEGTTAAKRRVRVAISCSQFLPAEDNGQAGGLRCSPSLVGTLIVKQEAL